jgi:hypothetical protein
MCVRGDSEWTKPTKAKELQKPDILKSWAITSSKTPKADFEVNTIKQKTSGALSETTIWKVTNIEPENYYLSIQS